MNRKLLGVLVLSVVVLAGATTLAFFSEEVIVESGQVDAVGKVTTINLTLSEVPGGLSGYNITVRLSNGSVAEIISVDFPGWATLYDNSTLPADAVWLKAADLMDQIKRNATDVILATLTIRGDEIGNTDIIADINKMDDDDGNPIYPSVRNGTFIVGPLPSPSPFVYISTDKTEYTTGDIMLANITIANPSKETKHVLFNWWVTVPSKGFYTAPLATTPMTLPPSYNKTLTHTITVGYWGAENFGAVFCSPVSYCDSMC